VIHTLIVFSLFAFAVQQPGQGVKSEALQQGLQLAQQNKLAEAELVFDSMPPSDPGYWYGRYYSAVAKVQLERPAPARPILERLLTQIPDFREAHLLMGIILEESREFAKAEVYFRKARDLAPEDPLGWIALGRVLLALNKGEAAEQSWQRARKLSPNHPSLPLLFGAYYYSSRQFEKAAQHLLPAWQANGGDLQIASQLATTYVALKDEVNLAAMLESLPAQILPEVELAVGRTYLNFGNEGQGFSHMVEAAKARPNDFVIQRALADAMFQSQLYRDAQQVYRDCLILKPNDGETNFYLARSLYEDRKLDEARSEFEKVVKLMPESAGAWFHLGISSRATQRTADAKAAFIKSLEFEKHPETYFNLGVLELTDGQNAAGEQWFQQGLAINPDHVGSLYELGRLRVAEGKYEEALSRLDRAVKTAPDHTQSHYQRGLALTRLGRLEESKQAFAIFQKLEQKDREKRKVIESKTLVPRKPKN